MRKPDIPISGPFIGCKGSRVNPSFSPIPCRPRDCFASKAGEKSGLTVRNLSRTRTRILPRVCIEKDGISVSMGAKAGEKSRRTLWLPYVGLDQFQVMSILYDSSRERNPGEL